MKVTFVLGKHPYQVDAGDTRISRIVIEAAAQSCTVRAIALSSGGDGTTPIPVVTVPKPARRLVRNLRVGRSLIHARFCPSALIRAVAQDTSDALVAEHIYMAEAPLAAGRSAPAHRLLINAHVLESAVLEQMPSPLAPLLRFEARRTARDEARCVRAAWSTACLGVEDMDTLARRGAIRLRRLDMLVPPAPTPAPILGRRALFIGGRRGWAPNRDAHQRMLGLWPRIAAAVPGAGLIVAGTPARLERVRRLPGLKTVGFVPDLDALWQSVSVLLAPVSIGGGVRVKILEAARHGVPVVATTEALGTIGEYLPIAPAADDEQFCDQAIDLLSDPARARSSGLRLYETARDLWESAFVQHQVERWIWKGWD